MKIRHAHWTPEMHARLEELWASGATATEIGREMGCTKNAVLGQVHRVGLPKRFSPIRKELPKLPKLPPARITMHNIAHDGCRWPFGHVGEEGFHLCGEPSAFGKPYCHDHCIRAYTTLNAGAFIPGPTALFFGGKA